MRKVLLKLDYDCNNNCFFCHVNDKKKSVKIKTEKIIDKIIEAKRRGYKMILFSGGEPTIRKDIFELADFIKKQDMYFGLITNGRMLSYEEFTKKLFSNNLRYCYVSLHGTKQIHEKLTNVPGSFNQTVKGIKNLLKYKEIEIIINIVVTKFNMDSLNDLIIFCKVELPSLKKIKFSLVIPEGSALINHKIIIPDIKKASKKIKEAIDYAKNNGMDAYFDEIPLCLMRDYENNVNNLRTNEIELMSEPHEDKLYPVDQGSKIKTDDCSGCVKNDYCEGIYPLYLGGYTLPFSSFNPKLEYVRTEDRFFDYCHYEYRPEKPYLGKLRSSNILVNSFGLSGNTKLLTEMMFSIRRNFGVNNIIWGVKKKDGKISWEYYFYNYNKKNPDISISNLINLFPLGFDSDIETIEKIPYFMFSFDIDNDTIESKIIEGINIYIKSQENPPMGLSYKLNKKGFNFENVYTFFNPKTDIKELISKIKTSVFCDFDKIKLSDILLPELIECKTICIANKKENDCIYFSGINLEQFIFFLKRFNYPKRILSFIDKYKSKLDHLQYDIHFDYKTDNNDLEIIKSGYYGTF